MRKENSRKKVEEISIKKNKKREMSEGKKKMTGRREQNVSGYVGSKNK